MEWFWVILLIIALQPAIRQRLVSASRQRMLAKIERNRGSRVILLVHRQETMSFLGFPLIRFIDIDDAEEVVRAIRMTDPGIPLDLILHTPGGLVLAATQIARAIHRWPGKVTVFVPHYAMSGGTLIALAADEIVMAEHAVLGAVDPQISGKPAASVLKVLDKKPLDKIDDETVILADLAEKATRQVHAEVFELLRDDYPEDKAESLARLLTEGTWTHDHPISCKQVEDLGLKVSCEVPDEIFQLMALFPQPTRRQLSVEYVPGRREAGPEPS